MSLSRVGECENARRPELRVMTDASQASGSSRRVAWPAPCDWRVLLFQLLVCARARNLRERWLSVLLAVDASNVGVEGPRVRSRRRGSDQIRPDQKRRGARLENAMQESSLALGGKNRVVSEEGNPRGGCNVNVNRRVTDRGVVVRHLMDGWTDGLLSLVLAGFHTFCTASRSCLGRVAVGLKRM